MKRNEMLQGPQTDLTMIHAEGARVGIACCPTCGAAILIDPRDKVDMLKIHRAWHLEV